MAAFDIVANSLYPRNIRRIARRREPISYLLGHGARRKLKQGGLLQPEPYHAAQC